MAVINIPNAIPASGPLKQGKNYFLHDPSISENPIFFKNILVKAQKSIRIMDPYAFEHDAIGVFENIYEDGITINIITIGYDENKIKSYADEIINVIKTNISSYNLSIISYKSQGVPADQRIPLWHDRYLIIDDTDFYLTGSSLDAQQISDKYHGVGQLVEKDDMDIIAELFNKYGNSLYNPLRAYKTTRKK